jgi:hypothetical protein
MVVRLTFSGPNETIELPDDTKPATGPTKKQKATIEQRMRVMFAIDDDVDVFSE